jgi:hypothetical protein
MINLVGVFGGLVNLRINLILLSGLWIVFTLFVLFSLGSVSLEEAEAAPRFLIPYFQKGLRLFG